MHFSDAGELASMIEHGRFPTVTRISNTPASPECDPVRAATASALSRLSFDLPLKGAVAVCIGSRGVHDLLPIVETMVEFLFDIGLHPIIVPAMGSHGDATAEGQLAILAGLGVMELSIGWPIGGLMTTLPFDEVEVLIVNEIETDISAAGMDTNAIDRYRVLHADDPDRPDIARISARMFHVHGRDTFV